jgi:nicotinate-nucleotide adenylyltransferase
MRIGLLGGTFDPIHYGHLLLAECCRDQCRLDQVFFVPAAVPPHKQGRTVAAADHRVAMIEAAINGQSAFAVTRYEVDRGGVNYTVDTLRHFHQSHPQDELFFLMGADMLADLPNWREAAEVCKLATPIAVLRPGLAALDFDALRRVARPEQIELIRDQQVDMPAIGISSSAIRQRVATRQTIRYWTPRAVEDYIASHRLYVRPGELG